MNGITIAGHDKIPEIPQKSVEPLDKQPKEVKAKDAQSSDQMQSFDS